MKHEMPTCSKTVTVWTEAETKLLLDKYACYLPDIGPFKQFRRKKDMWMTVALEFKERNWKQCEERFKTVMKRKAAVNYNTSSGAKRKKLQFEDEFEKINQLKDCIEPVVQISTQNIIKKSSRGVVPKSEKQLTIQETLLLIASRKEKAREKRHREKMERADRIENLLNKLIKKK